ncbi:hypothetical protein FNV43_RR16366 [Rhamnella rubrinervis]|uniref:Uncharacterized protein n=1 Tax=Rhamnella rubrinervis TaxID=2594499 RepID=A0A8K0GYN5_9ROSA|nr:hypothetical protein FNV43_RR16366 [Rhamnella rubrinervis]
MAQLPPKVPTMTQNWPSFPHQKLPSIANFMPSTTTTTTTTTSSVISTTPPPQQPPCWIDEFLDFTSTRSGNHRRSVSDSIAFLESPLVEECRNSGTTTTTTNNSNNLMHGSNGFDRLDDDQLMSMFSDDMSVTVPPTLSSSNPSTPSDQNSNNDAKPMLVDHHNQQQPKSEPGEVESSCEPADSHMPPSSSAGVSAGDPIIDPKRVKR